MDNMVTFQLESWAEYRTRCYALWEEHYKEFAPVHHYKMPMKPDEKFYEYADANGLLSIISAYSAGRMIGYFLIVFRLHPHYSVLCGFEDSYFLTKSFRKGLIGVRLIQRAEEEAKKRGARKLFVFTKEFNSLRVIFTRLKYDKLDEVYVKEFPSFPVRS